MQARLRAGLPEARDCRAAHVRTFLNIHIPWLISRGQDPYPSTGDGRLLHSGRGGPRILAGSASHSDLSRETRRRPRLLVHPAPALAQAYMVKCGPLGLLPCLGLPMEAPRNPCSDSLSSSSHGALPYPCLFPSNARVRAQTSAQAPRSATRRLISVFPSSPCAPTPPWASFHTLRTIWYDFSMPVFSTDVSGFTIWPLSLRRVCTQNHIFRIAR